MQEHVPRNLGYELSAVVHATMPPQKQSVELRFISTTLGKLICTRAHGARLIHGGCPTFLSIVGCLCVLIAEVLAAVTCFTGTAQRTVPPQQTFKTARGRGHR